jgi:hypothetical protein
MSRRPDSIARLDSYLDSVKWKRFAWGSHDCCYFASGCVEALTGTKTDLPIYNSRGSALRALQNRKTTVSGWVSSLLPEVFSVDGVREGDLVMLDADNPACVGLLESDGPLGVYYKDSVWLPGRIGLVNETDTTKVIRAWRV